MKLKLRLTLIIAAMMLVMVAVISTILLLEARKLQEDTARETLKNLTGINAYEMQTRYQRYFDAINYMAQIMTEYQSIRPEDRRSRYNEMLYALIETNPYFVGLYTVWKPGAVDGLDEQFANTPGTDSSGNFITWYYQETPASPIELRYYPDYKNIQARLNDDALARIPTVQDPEFWTLGGKKALVMNLSVPIIEEKSNTVAGLVGINIDLTSSRQVLEKLKPYEVGYAVLYAENGTIIGHPIEERIGQQFQPFVAESYGEDGLKTVENSIATGTPVLINNKTDIFQTYPFIIGDTKTHWTIVSTVPIETVMSTVNDLTNFTIILAVTSLLVSAVVIFFIAASIAKPIVNVSLTLEDISEGEGDLTKSIDHKSQDEIGDLAHHFNLTLDKIKNLVITIKSQATTLFNIGNELASNMTETAAAINQITANIQSIKSRVINQSASVTETNSTMEQITININKLNDDIEHQTSSVTQSSSAIEEMLANIQSVTHTLINNTENVKNLAEASEIGRTGLEEVAADIQGIAKESEGLLEINIVMEDIASQTNLLSMNAAIEAAHAGEAGKGFAVVADEIRKLAESSGEQSKTISTVLKKIKDSIDRITKSTDSVLNKFEAIDSGVKTVSDQEENIRSAMEEQNTGSQQILEALGRLNEITRKVKIRSVEMLAGSNEVIHESKNLEIVTQEITDGMNEMAAGADQINVAVNRVNEISGTNKENINILVQEVAKFKVE
ncbi:MAG: methyl-accepting chemotaxis protein [Treponema sp.]|nr:methyl-accepting chemotaxis protein [Treponema sp.]